MRFGRTTRSGRRMIAASLAMIAVLSLPTAASAQDHQPVDLETLRRELAEHKRQGEYAAKIIEQVQNEISPATGSEADALLQEARTRYAAGKEADRYAEWAVQALEQAEEYMQRAATTTRHALIDKLAQKAQASLDRSQDAMEVLIGRSMPATGAYVVDKPSPPTMPGSATPDSRYDTSLLVRMQQQETRSEEVAEEFNYQTILGGAQATFDETPGGRAGAGGVALYKAAEIDGNLNLTQVRQARWKKDHLTLVLENGEIKIPDLDREYVALATRCIYGKEGNVPGRLVAEDGPAIAIATGEQWYGEVIWNSKFLPEPWKSVPAGKELELSFGPGMGLIADPKPSQKRVTYYGPISGTRMGKVLFEADTVLFSLLTGVGADGMVHSEPLLPGFRTYYERKAYWQLQVKLEDRPPTPVNDDQSKWWRGVEWYVLVPDRFRLKFDDSKDSLEFVETKMKVAYWSVGANEALSLMGKDFAAEISERYGEFSEVFPALGQLVDVTKAVSVVRMMKQADVPMDVKWAKSAELENVDTPDVVALPAVFVRQAGDGVPTMAKGEVAQ